MLGKLKKKKNAYSISSGCHSKIHLTFEQCGLELHGSTYVWNFFSPLNTYCSTHDPQLTESVDAEELSM